MKIFRVLVWAAVALAGAAGLSAIAFERGEPLNATWFIIAAACTYLVAYRFYSAFISAKVLALDATRATPAERLDDGRDYVPTNKWVLLGHHFAAIAGPGPLVGPTLAAQFGYLPGTLWLIIGAVLGGCVQDFVILFCSMRRDGKSLGQMAREEVSRRGGFIAQIAVLAIMIILLAVVGLVVVNALKASPWGMFTLAMTIPIAMLMGLYLRYWRPGTRAGSVSNWSFAGAARCCCRAMGGGRAVVGANFFAVGSGVGSGINYLRVCGVGAARLVVAGAARLFERVY